MRKYSESIMKIVFLLSAAVSILAVLLICWFLFSEGLPTIGEIGVLNFLTGTVWKPLEKHFGILPMIVGSCCSSDFFKTNLVCGIGPSLESTRRITVSTVFMIRSTSELKSACPGVSTILIFTSLCIIEQFLE